MAVNSVPSATSGRVILTDGPSGLEQMVQKTASGSVATVVSFDDRWLNKPGPLDLALRRNIFHSPTEPFTGSSDGSTVNAAGKLWTEDETLRLLEGLERFGDNWLDISRHVGSEKSVEECVAHFLQMPIEDAYLDDQFRVKEQAAKPAAATSASAEKPLPFEAAANPVLAQLSFLNNCGAGSEVAHAAAQAALQVYVEAAKKDKNKEGSQETEESLQQKAAASASLGAAAAQAGKLAAAEGDEIRVLVVEAVQKLSLIHI